MVPTRGGKHDPVCRRARTEGTRGVHTLGRNHADTSVPWRQRPGATMHATAGYHAHANEPP